MQVRDYECDIQGIVNNANYLHYTEHTRHLYLKSLGVSRLMISGCATDFCVDTTVRSAASHGFEVLVLSDGQDRKSVV